MFYNIAYYGYWYGKSFSYCTKIIHTTIETQSMHAWGIGNAGGSYLSWIFGGHENLSGLSVIYIKLYKYFIKQFWQKIQAKQESSLTAVWLKWDPPVLEKAKLFQGVSLYCVVLLLLYQRKLNH